MTRYIEYKLWLRPGEYAYLTLPEDLTETEAWRIGRLVNSVAFAEQLPEVEVVPIGVLEGASK